MKQTMVQVKVFISLLISMALFACNTNAGKKKAEESKTATSPNTDFSHIDSVEFVYYPNPESQRQYQHTMVKEAALLEGIQQSLAAPAVEMEPCAHHVKLYLFKESEVYKTIYVSMSDSCRYLAYAVNSKRIFVQMDTALQQRFKGIADTLQ